MGLLNLDLKAGFDESLNRIKSPFQKLFATPLDMKGALERNDFPQGFEIIEIQDGKLLDNEKVTFLYDAMPEQPFTFGGNQKIVKDYYPGNTEPTVQVLGPRENNIVIKGRLKAKRFKDSKTAFAQKSGDNTGDTFRNWPLEMQQQIEAIRIRGNLLRLTMGEFQRYAFMEDAQFMMKTVADINYEITFSVIGFNPPTDCKILGRTKTVPFDINKELIRAGQEFQAQYSVVPDSMPKSLAEQFNDAISDVATAINLVTDFVDNVLNEVDSLKDSLARAKGLILNAKATASVFQRRVGGFNPTGNVSQVGGVSGAYKNASFFKNSLSSSFSLTAFLASLQKALAAIAETEPLARYKVQSGDTLQKLAVKFYKDATQWKQIYDHNKLQSTTLTLGAILEIPRIA